MSLCRQCVKKYHITEGDQNKSDVEQNESDNDYSCKTPRKKLNTSLNTTGISPVHLHGVAQHSQTSTEKNKLDRVVEVLKTSLSGAYVVSTDQLASSESVVISKTEQKASELDHLHNLMKENLTTATYSEKIQILTLAPDSSSRRYCAEHFYVSEYLVRTASELKKAKEILLKPAQKQGKVISHEFSRQMPGKKDYVSIAKGVRKQKRLVLCKLREIYAAFKEKYPNVKLGFSKFCTFRPKWCVCSIHQNATLLVDEINWDITYKDLILKIFCDSTRKEYMMHQCVLSRKSCSKTIS